MLTVQITARFIISLSYLINCFSFLVHPCHCHMFNVLFYGQRFENTQPSDLARHLDNVLAAGGQQGSLRRSNGALRSTVTNNR